MGWLIDELGRGQYNETEALCTRLLRIERPQPELLFTRAEAKRLRNKANDFNTALEDLNAAVELTKEPAETYRSMGLIRRSLGQKTEAIDALEIYVQRAPQAADAELIKSYIGELKV